MKKLGIAVACFFVAAGVLLASHSGVLAREKDNYIHSGIYIGDIDVSDMSREEAQSAVQSYVDELKQVPITLNAVQGNQVVVTAGELGITWANSDVVEDASGIGKRGNIVKRYKELMDLAHESKKFDLELTVDKNAIQTVLSDQCTQYDVEAEDAHLIRENGTFKIEGGQTGEKVDTEQSADRVENFLIKEWNKEAAELDLVVAVDEPKGSAEELGKVKDVLGTYTTSYTSSGSSRSTNVANGCSLINGTTIYPGEEFSAYDTVNPFSEENGYYLAGSYLNGMVVESLGGGICQVSTTLYNSVLLAELEVTERHNHSMEVSYVPASADAAIAESAGKDFRFINNTEYPIYIEGYTADKRITFTIYGVETRNPDRTVTYESEILSENRPTGEQIIADGSQPVGFVKVQSAHVGRTAKLWKVVKENGEEVSRTEVNSSSYKMVPRIATVGTATSDPVAANTIQAAIATNSIDYIKNVAAALRAGDPNISGQVALDALAAQQQAAGVVPEAIPEVAPEEATPDVTAPEGEAVPEATQ